MPEYEHLKKRAVLKRPGKTRVGGCLVVYKRSRDKQNCDSNHSSHKAIVSDQSGRWTFSGVRFSSLPNESLSEPTSSSALFSPTQLILDGCMKTEKNACKRHSGVIWGGGVIVKGFHARSAPYPTTTFSLRCFWVVEGYIRGEYGSSGIGKFKRVLGLYVGFEFRLCSMGPSEG